MKGNETQYETKNARPPAQSVFPFQILTYKYLRSLPLDCGWCSVQYRIFYGKQVCGGDVTESRESRASSLGLSSLFKRHLLCPPLNRTFCQRRFALTTVPTRR